MKKSSNDTIRDIRTMGQITKRPRVFKSSRNSPSVCKDLPTTSSYSLPDCDRSVSCSRPTTVDPCLPKSARYSEHVYESNSSVTTALCIMSNRTILPCGVLIKQENQSDVFSTSFLDVNRECVNFDTDSVISNKPCTCTCESCLNIHQSRLPENLYETTVIRTKSEIVAIPFKAENNYCTFNQAQSGETGQFDTRHPLSYCCAVSQTNLVEVGAPGGSGLSLPDIVLLLEQRLGAELLKLEYNTPVSHIYNPIEYAIVPHKEFLNRYCTDYKDVLFLGMNPGPYGMAQTGVPFGEISIVRDWLKICGYVMKPKLEHPKRPILGFNCKRKEVSGARFWKLFAEISGTPETFFTHCFVHNMCPLLFMSSGGKNLTPPDLPVLLRRVINSACDLSLCNVVKLLRVKFIVGVGRYATDRAKIALTAGNIENVSVVNIMHPSPANPAANKGWNEIVAKQLSELGLMPYISSIKEEDKYAKIAAS